MYLVHWMCAGESIFLLQAFSKSKIWYLITIDNKDIVASIEEFPSNICEWNVYTDPKKELFGNAFSLIDAQNYVINTLNENGPKYKVIEDKLKTFM